MLLLQKQAVRLISGNGYLEPTLPIFLELKIIPIVLQFKINKLILIYKSTVGLTPAYISEKFSTFVNNVNSHATRAGIDEKIYLPAYKSQYAKSFEITGIKIWNSIPKNIRSSATLAVFKRTLKIYVFHKLSSFACTSDI